MLAWRSSWLLPALLGGFVFIVYVFTFPNDIQGNGDTWLRFEMTQSVVDHATPYYSEIGTPTWTDKRVVPGVDKKLYTIYDPGQIIAMAPLYEIGRVLAHRVTGDYIYTPRYISFILDDIFGALLVILIFLMGLRLGYSRRTSALLGLIFAFATVAWPDAESYLEHTQVSFFLALSVLLSLIFVQEGLRRRRWLAAAAVALGCAFLTRYDTGILFPLIPLFVAGARIAGADARGPVGLRAAVRRTWAARAQKLLLRLIAGDWAVFALASVPAFVAAGAWNYMRFGSPAKTGIPTTFGQPFLQGFTGLTVSPGKGLIWYMPILFVLPFVVRAFYRRHRLVTTFFAGIVGVELILFSLVIYWHGDPAWGPRYIFPTVPYLILPMGVVLERWPELSAWPKRAFLGIVGVSVAVQVAAVVAPPYRFWYKEIHAQLVARQGFNWGYKNHQFWYFYYWDVPRSPILVNFQNLYEIAALRVFNQQQYDLGASPIPTYEHLNLANPVHSYEINNFNLWWLATQHPFLGTRRDAILAALLIMMGAGTFVLLRREIKGELPSERENVPALSGQPGLTAAGSASES